MSAKKSPAAVQTTADQLKAVRNVRDINVGLATVPYGYDNYGNKGWRLPGGGVTTDRAHAHWAAHEIDRLMYANGARGVAK